MLREDWDSRLLRRLRNSARSFLRRQASPDHSIRRMDSRLRGNDEHERSRTFAAVSLRRNDGRGEGGRGIVRLGVWCCSRRDTPVQAGGRLRGKRGYDGAMDVGMTEAGTGMRERTRI